MIGEMDFEHLLIEKPIALIFWKLATESTVVKDTLSREMEVKDINSLDDFKYWLHIGEVKCLVIGVKDVSEAKDLKEFVDLKLPVEKRRKLFVIYVLPNKRSMHPREIFLLSGNLLLAEEHLSEFPRAYEKAFKYWEYLYKPFKQAQVKLLGEEV